MAKPPCTPYLITDSGVEKFSKIDLHKLYHQLELDDDSRGVTTFGTHVGMFRHKCLFFSINTVSEIFQKAIHQVISECPGSLNISDDIIVHGLDDDEHDRKHA